uniref:C2 domain-containing protein n=1 Tax=Cajanus cajan TaxID=3821 RepID=A0A151SG22_CAJCA|nr:hypothetical protein KK1_024354 [Cajanus cajan]
MGIIWVEVCLISAHGLQHSTSLWKRQWFAVGWIDFNSKYCTKVVDSGSANPVWRTTFFIPVDDSSPNIQDLALNVEVYSIDPIFFKEKLHGSTTVFLKEFIVKQVMNYEVSKPRQQEVGSYQLRKRKSSKPRGFIDILIRVSDEKKESSSHSGNKEGILPSDDGDATTRWVNQATTRKITPPPPSPPYNAGYIPTFIPTNDGLPSSYIDMSTSREAPGQRVPLGVAMGLGAGALAAGAVIFGDDFMSGFDVPPALGDSSFNLEMDPPF